jgi:kynurenine formamidase
MRRIPVMFAATAVFLLMSGTLHAQKYQMPPDNQRCPSKWGADDQRGSANWMKPEIILRATKMIKTGQLFELGEILSMDRKESFLNGGRQYSLYTKPATPDPENRVENEELVISELGQIGTQIDAFAHQMYGPEGSFYNCFKQKDIATRNGFKKLGVENQGTLMTRGVLIDVAALKGVQMLPDTYVVTPEDLEQALAKENLKIQPGDAIIVNTGWGRLMGKDNDRYSKTSPGMNAAAGEWMAKLDPMLIGADDCCIDATPSGSQASLPIHAMMLIRYGIILLENLKLGDLADAKAYEFAFIVQPLKMKGATGSTVAPVAIR